MAKLKINITDLGTSANPFFSIAYMDGSFLGSITDLKFNFVAVRNNPFEAVIGPDLNQALKDAMDLDLVPTGEWTTSIDDYYLYVETNVPERWVYLTDSNYDMVLTVEISDSSPTVPIEIDQTLDSNALLNAFNDNVLKFTANSPVFDITANGQLPLVLFPSPAGEFYLNLKDLATTLINQNKFEDEILPDINSQGYVYPDPSLFLTMDLELSYQTFVENATLYFLKSVSQIAGYADKSINENYVLLPIYGAFHKVTYYEGFPFDIPLFSNQLRNITITNRTTGHNATLEIQQYTNRLFFSQGSENFTIEDVLPMQTGINRLELEFTPTDKIDLIVNKKESRCAPYFKFYRNTGGFGYIRFEKEITIKNKTKDGESIRTDFDGIQNTLRRSIADKSTTVEIELQTEALEVWEMENFKDFISSPRVEMYVGKVFQKQTDKSWVGVQVSSSSLTSTKTKTAKNREEVKVEFELYNLYL